MVMTLTEFKDLFQFVGQLFFGSFKTLDAAGFYSDGGITISILTILIGLFIADLLIEKILEWIHGA